MVELVDAPGSGPGPFVGMGVRIPPSAQGRFEEDKMRNYEALFIFKAQLSTEELEKKGEYLKELVERNKGMTGKVDIWGKRSLAYPIKKEEQGNYLLFSFSLEQDSLPSLEEELKRREEIIRYLIVKK